jgi:hypothetical protein
MRVTLLKRLLVKNDEHWFRKDTTLLVPPLVGEVLYIRRREGVLGLPESFEDTVSPLLRTAVVEGSDRLVVFLDYVTEIFESDYGPLDRSSHEAWGHWFYCYGFAPTEETDPMKLTPWSVPESRQKAEAPRHASPCCGMESTETGLVGTAYLYTCYGCRHIWHYAGGRKVIGTPTQQEPGVRLSDAMAPLDPTAPLQFAEHPDGFPGTDEGSHYMSQTKLP